MKLKLITILLFFVYCTETIEPTDCNGVSGGNSVEDNCGICDNDSSNDCVQDCHGEWGGNEILDIKITINQISNLYQLNTNSW